MENLYASSVQFAKVLTRAAPFSAPEVSLCVAMLQSAWADCDRQIGNRQKPRGLMLSGANLLLRPNRIPKVGRFISAAGFNHDWIRELFVKHHRNGAKLSELLDSPKTAESSAR